MPHYREYTDYIYIEDGITINESIPLEPMFGILNVYTKPAGSSVYLNEEFIGKTPLINSRVDEGYYNITVKTEDDIFHPLEDELEIYIGGVNNIEENLQHKKANLTVLSEPTGAEIFIDNKLYGTTPHTIRSINTGYREIYLEKGDYAYRDFVDIKYRKKNTYSVKLAIKQSLKPYPDLSEYAFPGSWQTRNKDDSSGAVLSGLEFVGLTGGLFFQVQGNNDVSSILYSISIGTIVYNIINLLDESKIIKEAKEAENKKNPIIISKYMTIQKSGNIRKGPSTRMQIIGHTMYGDKFDVVAKQGNWYKVKVPFIFFEDYGWIFHTLLERISYTDPKSISKKTFPDTNYASKSFYNPGSGQKAYFTENPQGNIINWGEVFWLDVYSLGLSAIVGIESLTSPLAAGAVVSYGFNVFQGLIFDSNSYKKPIGQELKTK